MTHSFTCGTTEYGTPSYYVTYESKHDGYVAEYVARRIMGERDDGSPFLDEDDPIEIGVKWDGCANISFGPDCVHTCSREDMAAIGTLLVACFDHAGKNLSSALKDAFK